MDQQELPDNPDIAKGQQRWSNRQRGEDLYCQLAITFEEAVLGCQKEIEQPRWDTCLHCKGSGAQHGTSRTPCAPCEKTGEIRRIQESIIGPPFIVVTRCQDCQGEGWLVTTLCDQCHGQGRVPSYHHVTVDVPAGIDDGANICLKDKGHIGIRGGSPGDLYVMVTVKPHSYLKRQGNDLLCTLYISFAQATLGHEVEICLPDGTMTPLTIPAGTQGGQSFTLKGMGLPIEHGSNRGDMHVVVQIKTLKLTPEEETLFQEFDRQMKLKRQELFSKVGLR